MLAQAAAAEAARLGARGQRGGRLGRRRPMHATREPNSRATGPRARAGRARGSLIAIERVIIAESQCKVTNRCTPDRLSARVIQLPPDQRMLVLETGTHFVNETLRIGPELSGLTIRAAPNAKPVLSGGQLLSVKWAPKTVPSGAKHVFSASLKGQGVDWTMRSLFTGVGVGRRVLYAHAARLHEPMRDLRAVPSVHGFAVSSSGGRRRAGRSGPPPFITLKKGSPPLGIFSFLFFRFKPYYSLVSNKRELHDYLF